EVIRLNFFVAGADFAGWLCLNLGPEPAALIERGDREIELVALVFGAHAGERFLVLLFALAAHGIRNACLGHQIAFVSGIDEYLAPERRSIVEPDLIDARTLLAHTALLEQAVQKEHAHSGF